MAKFQVQAVTRQGFPGSYRAGRFWPSNAPTEIEVVEQDADPEPDPKDPNRGIVVGRRNFEALHKDPNLRVVPAGDPMAIAKASEDVPELRRVIDRQAEEIRELQKRLGQQEGGAGGTKRVTGK